MLKLEKSFNTPEGIFALTWAIDKLKKLKRTGWVLYSIPDPESVADHSYGVAVLAMFLAKHFNVDQDKVIRMALLHDLGETVTGDLPIERGNKVGTGQIQKRKAERRELHAILENTGNKGDIILFDEYVAGETPEAQFVHQLDKLEMAFQACQYEKDHNIVLEEFMVNAKKHVTNEALRSILETILKNRV